MKTMQRVAGLMLAMALEACATAPRRGEGGGGSARVAAAFPTRAELARAVSAGRAQAAAPREPTAVLERWELAGPFPAVMGTRPAADATPFAALLRPHAERSSGRMVLSEAMQCTARELGRYMVGHEGAIPQPLADFVTGRCGTAGPFAGAWMTRGTAPAAATEDQLVTRYRAQLADAVQQFAVSGAGPVNVGAWFGRDGVRFLFLLVMEARRVEAAPLPFTAGSDGRVTVEGRVLADTAHVIGYVNQGAWSSALCEPDASVRLPRFRLRCPVAPGDAAARVELSAIAPGRLLGHTVFSAVVGPGRDAARTFEVRAADPARVTTDPARAREALVEALNEARAAAGVAPVTLASREADVACEATPAYFAAAGNPSGAEGLDRIALGLMAGWDVQGGMIREGSFFTGAGAQEDDMSRWVHWALERPLARQVLLEGEVRQVAVCPWAVEGHTQGVLWSSYRFFAEGTQPRELARVYERLDAARRAGGRGPAERIASLEAGLKAHAQALERGRNGLEPTLQAMLETGSNATGLPVRGWVIPTTDLESVEFPSELLEASSLQVAAQVAHWRAPDGAWGQTVVFLVAPSR